MYLVDSLIAAGAKAVGFDIIFENADKDEEVFANTLQKHRNVVIATEFNGALCAAKLEKFLAVSRQKVE